MPVIHRVLCVDDETPILSGMERNLRRLCPVVTASSGQAALELLRKDRDFAVIISDMRMPEMDGAQFLTQAKLLVPGAVRILLTGQADLEAVINAINGGNISLYLRKPVEREVLQDVVQRAFVTVSEQTEARARLLETARGAFMLALAERQRHDPAGFNRAHRVAELSQRLAEQLGLRDAEQASLAALACELGASSSAKAAVRAVLADELFDGVMVAVGEEWSQASTAQRSVLAKVVGAARTIDQLQQTIPGPESLAVAMALQVDGRMLDAFHALEPSARAAA